MAQGCKTISQPFIDIETLIQKKIKDSETSPTYKKPLTHGRAYEEVICDSCESFLRDSNLTKRLVDLAKADMSLFERTQLFIDEILADVKAAYTGLTPDSREGRAVLEMVDCLEELHKKWEDAALDARSNYQQAGGKMATKNTADSGVRYQAKQDITSWNISWDSDNFSDIKTQLKNHLNEVNNMQPVTEIKYDKNGDKPYYDLLNDILKIKFGYKIERKDFGSIIFDPKAISGVTKYVSSDAEAAAILASPYVLKRGTAISGHKNHKLKGYPSVTFAAPVILNGDRGNVAVVVLYGGKNRVHAVRVLTPSGSIFTLSKIEKDAESTSGSSTTISGVGLPINSAPKVSIPNPDEKVNTDSTKKSDRISDADADYMTAVKNGDMETAQRLVNEAAVRAGYTMPLYHGAKNGGGFSKFRDWSYFTPNKDYATRYTQRGNESASLYSVFVKAKHAFDTRKAKVKKIFETIKQEYGLSDIQASGLPDWTDGYDIADFIDENDLDYDAILLDEGGDLVDGKPVSRGISYVVRKSAQIKSAEAVTYDDNGNVIPLSQRFDESNSDIRYSDRAHRYSYDALVSKPDMSIAKLSTVPKNELSAYISDKDLFAKDMRKIAMRAKNEKNTSTATYLYCKDLGEDVLITRDSFKHGAARMDATYISVCKNISDILNNSIVVNELSNREHTNGAYVLLGLAETNDNYVVVRSIINKKTWKLEEYNELNAIKEKGTKKEDVGPKPPHYDQKNGYGTSSSISISDFLTFVNSQKLGNSVLSLDVLNKLGSKRGFDENVTPNLIYSDRASDSMSNRALLVNALESTIDTSTERGKMEHEVLARYKEKIEKIDALNRELTEVKAEIKELSFARGKRDTKRLAELHSKAKTLSEAISREDKRLLNIEANKHIKDILEREKKKAVDRQKAKDKQVLQDYKDKSIAKLEDTKKHYQEARRKNVEGRQKTAERNAIKGKIQKLTHLFKHGTKDNNIKIGLQSFVEESLKAAEVMFGDENNESYVAKAVQAVIDA